MCVDLRKLCLTIPESVRHVHVSLSLSFSFSFWCFFPLVGVRQGCGPSSRQEAGSSTARLASALPGSWEEFHAAIGRIGRNPAHMTHCTGHLAQDSPPDPAQCGVRACPAWSLHSARGSHNTSAELTPPSGDTPFRLHRPPLHGANP
jgi:hypothetical protein